MKRKLEEYIRVKRCKNCGHTSFWLDKARLRRQDYCSCEGYHYTHRKGSKFCTSNPRYEINVRTVRYSEELFEVLLDIAIRDGGSICDSTNPPF